MRSLFLFLLLFFCAFSAFAQFEEPAVRSTQFPLELTVGKHAIRNPFYRIFRGPLHPALSLGTEYAFREGTHRVYMPLRILGFYNAHNPSGFALTGGLGYRYTHSSGIFADADASLGYLHTFRPYEKLVWKDGAYTKRSDWGKPTVYAGHSLSVGYDFFQRTQFAWSVFVRLTQFAQWPYAAPENKIWPHQVLSIGLRFQPDWNGVECPPGVTPASGDQ